MSNDKGFRYGLGIGLRLGTELIVATIVGLVMGYALDKAFDTSPWFLVMGIFFGAAAGCLNAYRSVQEFEDINNDDKPDV
ncbi:MAG: AtpZ/AtpI family protein [Nitrospinales bacterium]